MVLPGQSPCAVYMCIFSSDIAFEFCVVFAMTLLRPMRMIHRYQILEYVELDRSEAPTPYRRTKVKPLPLRVSRTSAQITPSSRGR